MWFGRETNAQINTSEGHLRLYTSLDGVLFVQYCLRSPRPSFEKSAGKEGTCRPNELDPPIGKGFVDEPHEGIPGEGLVFDWMTWDGIGIFAHPCARLKPEGSDNRFASRHV